MIKTTIDCTVGIYDTEYTVRDYGTRIVVTIPGIRWVGSIGNLNFWKKTIYSDEGKKLIREMTASETLVSDSDTCPMTMDNVCERYN